MNAGYRHLPLSGVKPGMVLATELLDLQGHMLLPQGTVLTEAMLSHMPRHGITSLPVEQQPMSAEELAALQAAQRERLAYLFRKTAAGEDDWAANALRQLVALHRLGPEAQ
ncbi:hypothetical protein [Pseudoduganella rhizocola]|uniref:hypothetical protein n=1 Tax=Pseudoduganella rhizocola TaxID=3382643 RepID=UPI0038B4A12B